MTTAVINDTELEELDLEQLLANGDWFWYDDVPTFLTLARTAELIHQPLPEVQATWELLTGNGVE